MPEQEMEADETTREVDLEANADPQPEDNNNIVETSAEMDGGEATDPPAPEAEPAVPQPDALSVVNQTLSELRELFEKQIARNQNQIQMFDKVYGEMKDYKENFLLEALHKPIVHNLIRLYDNFVLLESQLGGILDGIRQKKTPFDELEQFYKNLENVRFELEEVLYRMDVEPDEEHSEMLDRRLHKTLNVKPTDDPEQDRKLASVHKIRFNWREKVFRPAEVTIFRYTPPETEEGEETDG